MEARMIGGKIAEARKKINISQAQLAQQLFISPQAVGKWERGESIPDILTVIRLATILGVDLNYFSDSSQIEADKEGGDDPLVKQSAELVTENPHRRGGWDMSSGNWADADFSGLKNLVQKFSSSNIQRCKFVGSELSGLVLKNNNINNCNFASSNINRSRIRNSNLSNNLFNDCLLKDADFYGCYIKDCDFTGAAFKSGGIQGNLMNHAVLNRTSFNAMHIAETLFDGVFVDCSFDHCAFTKVTFQNSTLINTFFKNNKNLKRVNFIDCKVDRITYEFLKIGKADISGIAVMQI